MAYSTVQDLVDRFGTRELVQLSNPEDSRATTVNEPHVLKALEEASAVLDGYIGVRRATPVPAPVPLVLKAYTEDVAMYGLTTLRSKGATEDARKRYEDAIKWAREYAAGKASLGAPEPDAGGVLGAEFSASERLFTRGSFYS